jgi:hypothetical protein
MQSRQGDHLILRRRGVDGAKTDAENTNAMTLARQVAAILNCWPILSSLIVEFC